MKMKNLIFRYVKFLNDMHIWNGGNSVNLVKHSLLFASIGKHPYMKDHHYTTSSSITEARDEPFHRFANMLEQQGSAFERMMRTYHNNAFRYTKVLELNMSAL